MKRNVTVRLTCLIVAAVVLGGAVAFAAVLGSPYDTLKNAALTTATLSNVTIESQMTLSIDGQPQQIQRGHQVLSERGSLRYSFDEDGNPAGFHFSADGLSLSWYPVFTLEDGTEWYSAHVYPPQNRMYNNHVMFSPEDLTSAQMRFMELLVDLIVGDLKNNVTMSSNDGIRTVRATLTNNQIPEIAKAGIDMLIEQQNRYFWDRVEISFDGSQQVYEIINISNGMKTSSTWKQPVRLMTDEEEYAWNSGMFWTEFSDVEFWGTTEVDGVTYFIVGPTEPVSEYTAPATRADYGDDPLRVPMKSLTINFVSGQAEIDPQGNLRSININGSAVLTNIFGETHQMEADFSASFSNIGSSNPGAPIPGVEQVLTHANMSNRFGMLAHGISVYFTLNADGSINEDSITTTYPGEQDFDARFVFGSQLPQSGSSTDFPSIMVVIEGEEPVDITDDDAQLDDAQPGDDEDNEPLED